MKLVFVLVLVLTIVYATYGQGISYRDNSKISQSIGNSNIPEDIKEAIFATMISFTADSLPISHKEWTKFFKFLTSKTFKLMNKEVKLLRTPDKHKPKWVKRMNKFTSRTHQDRRFQKIQDYVGEIASKIFAIDGVSVENIDINYIIAIMSIYIGSDRHMMIHHFSLLNAYIDYVHEHADLMSYQEFGVYFDPGTDFGINEYQ